MLDPANILPDRKPRLGLGAVERRILGLAREADEIPARIDKRVEGVSLTPRLAAAGRAINQTPAVVPVERVAGQLERHICGQHHGQLVARNADRAALVAMDDRDRRAPVTLAAHPPIAQAILGLALAPASSFGAADDLGAGGGAGQAIQKVAVDRDSARGLCLDHRCARARCVGGDHTADRKLVFGGEFIVAQVVRGHPEQGAGAIIHQHEIGDPHRQLAAWIERVEHFQPGVMAELFGGLDFRRRRPALAAPLDECLHVGVVRRQPLGDRMTGRYRDEARAEDGVGPGGEYLDVGSGRSGGLADHPEAELQALAFADPVFLHQPDLVGPIVERAQPGEQFFGEIGNPEEPLAQFLTLDWCARSPTLAVDYLLVGQHGHVDRVPIDLALLAEHQPGFHQVEEQCLLMAVIIGLAGGELAAPVEGEADALQLPAHRRNIGPGPGSGVDLVFHRGIFGRHSKCVPAHRVEHFEALHPPEPGKHVAHRVIADVPHVDPPRGVGKHLEDIAFGLGAGAVGDEALRRVPARLPAGIGNARVEPRAIVRRIGGHGRIGVGFIGHCQSLSTNCPPLDRGGGPKPWP